MIAAGLFHVLPWICLAVVAFGVVVIGTTMQRAEKMADKLAARDSARRDAVLARDEAAFLLWADESSTDDDQHADVRVELAAAKRSFKWLRENMADPERRGMEEREYWTLEPGIAWCRGRSGRRNCITG